MAKPNRYDGKPLLRLFELYVLDAIGELHEVHRQGLERMASKLQKTFGGSGDWHEAIAAAGQIPPESPEAIRDSWAKNLSRENMGLTPQKFAEVFVDRNFPF